MIDNKENAVICDFSGPSNSKKKIKMSVEKNPTFFKLFKNKKCQILFDLKRGSIGYNLKKQLSFTIFGEISFGMKY